MSKKQHCPGCDVLVKFDYDNPKYDVYCEKCGDHSAVKCSNCGRLFDHVWGYDEIKKYQSRRRNNKK